MQISRHAGSSRKMVRKSCIYISRKISKTKEVAAFIVSKLSHFFAAKYKRILIHFKTGRCTFKISRSYPICALAVLSVRCRFHEEYELEKKEGKYIFWYKHGLAMLNINGVDVEDAGQYSCVATNRLGACTTVGELNVQGG